MKNYDIIIIGGGIVGLTMANALANSNLRIAIVDKGPFAIQPEKKDYDARVSAITVASQRSLEKLMVWPAIAEQRKGLFRKMHVWNTSGGGSIDFDCADSAEDTLGYVIENRILQNVLLQKLKTYANVEFIPEAEINEQNNFPPSIGLPDVTINLKNNSETYQLNCQLLIGADGAESKVRQLAGIEITSNDYGHSALVTTVKTTLPHQDTAWQHFLSDGILAFLPLDDPHTCSIVWSSNPENANRLAKCEATEFKQAIAQAFECRLGDITDISQRWVFPLQRRHAKQYVKDHIALIGDAAHTIHPLAGQGLNLGIADATCLAEIILTAHTKNRSISSLATLRPYERTRKSENLLMLSVVGGIKQLFAQKNMPLQTLRGLGMNALNKIPLVKNYLVRRAGL